MTATTHPDRVIGFHAVLGQLSESRSRKLDFAVVPCLLVYAFTSPRSAVLATSARHDHIHPAVWSSVFQQDNTVGISSQGRRRANSPGLWLSRLEPGGSIFVGGEGGGFGGEDVSLGAVLSGLERVRGANGFQYVDTVMSLLVCLFNMSSNFGSRFRVYSCREHSLN